MLKVWLKNCYSSKLSSEIQSFLHTHTHTPHIYAHNHSIVIGSQMNKSHSFISIATPTPVKSQALRISLNVSHWHSTQLEELFWNCGALVMVLDFHCQSHFYALIHQKKYDRAETTKTIVSITISHSLLAPCYILFLPVTLHHSYLFSCLCVKHAHTQLFTLYITGWDCIWQNTWVSFFLILCDLTW